MKRRKLLLSLAFSAMAISTIVGCGDPETATNDGNGEPASQTLV